MPSLGDRSFVAGRDPDGSWGESVEGNRRHCYVPSKEGHPVMTAWAVLALVAAGCKGSEAVRRGVAFLARSQEADGGWRSPNISGAFMYMNAMAYGSHVRIFPLWALAAADEGESISYRVRA